MNIDKESNFISNIIYLSAVNDETRFWGFMDSLLGYMESRFKKYELVFVSDSSNNGLNGRVKEQIKTKNISGSVTFVELSQSYGLEVAMSAGIDMAIGDYVFEFDRISDKYDAELFEKVYKQCMAGNDIVNVVPKKTKRFSSKLFYAILNKYKRQKNGQIRTDLFHLISRRAINRVRAMAISVPYRKLQYAQCGLNLVSVEFDYDINDQAEGDFQARTQLATESLILFTNFVSRLTIGASILFLLISLVIIIYALVGYFALAKPVEGWTSLIMFIALGFFGVFAILSAVVKYLDLLIKMVFSKQEYLVRNIEKL